MPALTPKIFEDCDNSYDGDVALYIHWPFCAKKCPYCDFNSHVREQIDAAAWQNALVSELNMYAETYPNIKVSSIFFGGGTPSLMPSKITEKMLSRIDQLWGISKETEITLEANPDSVEAARFADYRAAGVNRISIGVQSLKDESLQFLGRLHTAKEALDALKIAGNIFDRVSFDLIYALPQQTLEGWRTELEEALHYAKGHISLYQLTIEEGTAFYHQFNRGKFTLPDEGAAADLYELTQEITSSAGLPAYEVSNHAAPGQESKHNLSYWQGDPFIGIGPGAHGRIPAKRNAFIATDTIKRPENWLDAVAAKAQGIKETSLVSPEDRIGESLLMGLRLNSGIDVNRLDHMTGLNTMGHVDQQALQDLTNSGHITHVDNRLSMTAKGMPLLNGIIGKLLI